MGDTLSAVVSTSRSRRNQPALFVGLNADLPTALPSRVSLAGLDVVEIGRADECAIVVDSARVVRLGLPDARLSQRHARLRREGASWLVEDLESKNGLWMRGHRFVSRSMVDGDVVIAGHTVLIFRAEGGEAPSLGMVREHDVPGFSTASPVLETQFSELAKAAASSLAIEIAGETGTGKELIARGVHTLSRRRGQFVAVNCGAIAETLLEGELFGHRKGAYSGAREERTGLVRSADGGTLFLDEVAELPSASQSALLRVLQESEVTPLGADQSIKVDLRIVTATHQNLDEAVAAGRFRADLRARLLGFRFELPSLRDRPEDLSLLISALLRRGARTPRFAIDAASALYAYEWPLNVRELERALEAAAVVASDRIELVHLPSSLRTPRDDGEVDASLLSATDRELRELLTAAISRHDGNLAEVARELKKDRTQLRRWMKRLGLRRE